MMVANGEAGKAVGVDLPGGRELGPLDYGTGTAKVKQPELELVDLGQSALQLALDGALVGVHHPAAHLVERGQILGLLPQLHALHSPKDLEAAEEDRVRRLHHPLDPWVHLVSRFQSYESVERMKKYTYKFCQVS